MRFGEELGKIIRVRWCSAAVWVRYRVSCVVWSSSVVWASSAVRSSGVVKCGVI